MSRLAWEPCKRDASCKQIRIVNPVRFVSRLLGSLGAPVGSLPPLPSFPLCCVSPHRSDSPFQGTDCDETDWRNVAAQRCRPPEQRRWKHEEVTTWRIATERSQSVGQWVVVLRVVASAGCVRTRTYTRPADRQAGRQSKPASKPIQTGEARTREAGWNLGSQQMRCAF